jgi:hypothetical protein
MSLLNKKANDIFSKIAFAKERIEKIRLPDSILETYIEPLTSWLDTLRERAERAKNDFEQFVCSTDFAEEQYLREEPQRRLLADILRDFEDIERRLYIGVDTFLPLIVVWRSQRKEKEIKQQHGLLACFLADLLELSHISEPMMVIMGETYECLPIEWGQTIKHVVFGPYSEIQNLRKWVILAHELGHAYFDLNAERFSSALFAQVIRKLIEVRPINVEQIELESTIYAWTRNWIPELVSDSFAVKTLGPAFVTQFMVTVLDSQPNRLEFTHPPPGLRVRCMLNTLESLNLSDINVSSYRNIWQSYCFTTSRPSSLYIVHEEVVRTAMDGIDSIVQEKPIENKWSDILNAKKALSHGSVPAQDVLSVVSALAIAEPSVQADQIYKALLERHSSNPNAS